MKKIKTIVAHGDSHAKGRYGWLQACRETGINHKEWWKGPILLHTITKENPQFTANKLKRVSADAYFLCAGEIDIRCHVVGQAEERGVSIENVAIELAEGAASWLKRLNAMAASVQVGHMMPVPPYNTTGMTYAQLREAIAKKAADSFSAVGPAESRALAHSTYRNTIKELLKDTSVVIMDLTPSIANSHGTLRKELVESRDSDGTHLLVHDYHRQWMKENMQLV